MLCQGVNNGFHPCSRKQGHHGWHVGQLESTLALVWGKPGVHRPGIATYIKWPPQKDSLLFTHDEAYRNAR